MSIKPRKEEISGKFELHYSFNDNSHSMDATIRNNSEREFLALMKEISSILKVDIRIESEALTKGGFRQRFKIVKKSETKRAPITASFVTSLMLVVLGTPLNAKVDGLFHKVFAEVDREDPEMVKLMQDIQKLSLENQYVASQLNRNNKINRRKSNFYETLLACFKINKIGLKTLGKDGKTLLNEYTILRKEFTRYILKTDELPTLVDENAVIEIISPVLKNGNYSWKGIYNGQILDFGMKSAEFKSLVQLGDVEFKNGTCINCILEMPRKIDNLGEEVITAYRIAMVISFFKNDKPMETPEGRKYKQELEARGRQLRLLF